MSPDRKPQCGIADKNLGHNLEFYKNVVQPYMLESCFKSSEKKTNKMFTVCCFEFENRLKYIFCVNYRSFMNFAAHWAFEPPTSLRRNKNCRFKFDKSIVSMSMT